MKSININMSRQPSLHDIQGRKYMGGGGGLLGGKFIQFLCKVLGQRSVQKEHGYIRYSKISKSITLVLTYS